MTRPQLPPWIAPALSVLVLVAHALRYPAVFEDSYISYRYADHLVAGHGFVFNPGGPPVEGFTSTLWVFVLAAARLLVDDLQSVGPWLSLAAAAGTVWVTWELARRTLRDPVWAGVAALLVAVDASTARFGITGMESTLFGLLTVAALLVSRFPKGRGDAALIGLGVAMALCRPEGLALVPAVVALGLPNRGLRRTLGVASAIALIFGAWFAWRWSHFGYPFPNTYYAKIDAGGSDALLGLAYVEGFLGLHLGAIGLLGFVLARRQRWVGPVALLTLAGLGVTVWVGGDQFPLFRFLLPVVPLLALGTAAGLQVSVGRRWAIAVPLVIGICALKVASPTLARPTHQGIDLDAPTDWQRIQVKAQVTLDFERIAAWMAEHVDPSAVVALNVAGVIPYRTGFQTLDMLGLNDAHIAHTAPQPGASRGHQKSDPAYVLEQAPDVILIGLPRVFDHKPSTDELQAIWNASALPGDRVLLNSDAFHDRYSLVKGPIDATGWAVLWVRRDRMGSLFVD